MPSPKTIQGFELEFWLEADIIRRNSYESVREKDVAWYELWPGLACLGNPTHDGRERVHTVEVASLVVAPRFKGAGLRSRLGGLGTEGILGYGAHINTR